MVAYPQRPRRNRSSQLIRDLVAETVADKRKLIMPHFVCEGRSVREPIPSMPGIDRVSIDFLLQDLESDCKTGMDKIILFGIPDRKDEVASEAYNPNGVIQNSLHEVKKHFPAVMVITDVCLCEYTSHGHCGIVRDGKVLNDPTLELLAKTALTHAEAGADMVAPSDMMDFRVREIRRLLDEKGFTELPVLAYSAKYSSAFYGPFRDAAGSAPQFGDRSGYQMDCRNSLEADIEVLIDIEEGADIVMVKPALSYLDVICRVKKRVNLPLCAYNVSGEYSMVKAMARLGWGDEARLVKEIITSIFRAGADMIISYHTRDIFRQGWLS
jgi:porphobilinogen synthase